ncbi:MAG: CpsD/CapB family tyrosine-protein kinase [Eggerthellaceae bacterium]|nr:CpsD/CapB family tyrosine-protein kinase [Eggerthellaceae bacterium]
MAKKKIKNNLLEVQNSAKTLFANIRFLSPDKPIRSIAITSSVPAEGKTTTTVQLAEAIASSDKTVLLVECDMRKHDLSSVLHAHCPVGLYAVMTEEEDLDEAVVETDTPNMFFLDIEPSTPNPTDIISSDSFKNLTKKLAENYDYVLYNTPPVGTFVDAAVLSTLMDGTLFVVRMNSTKRDEVVNAFEQLRKAGGNVIGSVATFCEEMGSQYYYGYYGDAGPSDESVATTSEATAASAKEETPKGESLTPAAEPERTSTRNSRKKTSTIARHSHENLSSK